MAITKEINVSINSYSTFHIYHFWSFFSQIAQVRIFSIISKILVRKFQLMKYKFPTTPSWTKVIPSFLRLQYAADLFLLLCNVLRMSNVFCAQELEAEKRCHKVWICAFHITHAIFRSGLSSLNQQFLLHQRISFNYMHNIVSHIPSFCYAHLNP